MLPGKNRVGVVIAAAGRGSRMGKKARKQFMILNGCPILLHTLKRFQASRIVDCIVVVVGDNDIARVERMVASAHLSKVCAVVHGGSVRQKSVWNGLRELRACKVDIVLVHDAVRPFVSPKLIGLVARVALEHGACIPAVPVKDTIKLSDGKGKVKATLPRESLWAVQTPQGFRYSLLWRGFEKAVKTGFSSTDEAGIVEQLGHSVTIIGGSHENIKITTPDDLRLARLIAGK